MNATGPKGGNLSATIETPATPGKPRLGHVLFGAKFISEFCPDTRKLIGKRVIHLGCIDVDYWAAAQRLGISCETAQDAAKYECPWTNNQFYWWYPLLLETCSDVPTLYREELTYNVDVHKVIREGHSNLYYIDHNELCDYTDITRTMLGHGFTPMTMPNDGHGCIELARVLLSNGESLIVACWVWYNK